MPGCIVSATTASFRSVEKRRLRATPVITSTLENVSDIGTCLGLSLGPPASADVRSKRGALHADDSGGRPPNAYRTSFSICRTAAPRAGAGDRRSRRSKVQSQEHLHRFVFWGI